MKLRSKLPARPRRTTSVIPEQADPILDAAAGVEAGETTASLKIDHILVPLDFSIHSQRALQHAVLFAQQFDATLTLLHVVEPVVYPAEFGYAPVAIDTLNRSSVTTAQERLVEFIDKKVPAEVRSEMLVKAGSAFDEITRTAREIGADLIIVSTHGYTGLKHVLLGSTAERVVRHAPCPVLVLRQKSSAA